MAKSKNGGTRAYIRGRIGSDVYSIGKDGKGERQQVVRSLAEQVANPRTSAQMFGRMIMTTVMQAVSGLSAIIDHSFDGMAKGQPSISEFIRRNYALIKADAAGHPASGNAFGLCLYQEKGVKRGAYVISNGNAVVPAAAALTAADGILTLSTTEATLTVGGLKEALNFGTEDYLTLVGITSAGEAQFCRVSIDPSIADATVITDANINDVLKLDGNKVPTLAVAGSSITVTLADIAGNCGVIASIKSNGSFIHSSCTLSTPVSPIYTSDIALPTYPVGSEAFLNGGDLQGGDQRAVVTVPSQVFKDSTTSADVTIVSYVEQNGYILLVDAQGNKYTCQAGDDELTSFGKHMGNKNGATLGAMWNHIDAEGAGANGTVKLEQYTQSEDEGYALGSAQVNWFLSQGFNMRGFFIAD